MLAWITATRQQQHNNAWENFIDCGELRSVCGLPKSYVSFSSKKRINLPRNSRCLKHGERRAEVFYYPRKYFT